MTTIAEVEDLVRRHEIDAALEEIGRMLEERPDDAEASMLFGVCQQMKGRTEAFCEVYRDLAPSMSVREAAGEVSSTVTRWRHYLRVASYLLALGVITLTGSVYAESQSAMSEGAVCEDKSAPVVGTATKIEDFQAAANDPSVAQMAQEDPDGCRIFIADDGSMKVISTGTGVYDFNDNDEIQDACKEATRAAKAHLVKFFTENFSTEEQATNATKKAKCLHSDGKNKTVAVSKETLKATIEVVNRNKYAILSGVVVLKDETIPSVKSGGTVRVTVGVSSTTLMGMWGRAPAYGMHGRPMTRYNMGGRPRPKPQTDPIPSKYGMGGKPIGVLSTGVIEVDDCY